MPSVAMSGQSFCQASRDHGIGAREKHSVTLFESRTTFTTFGLKTSVSEIDARPSRSRTTESQRDAHIGNRQRRVDQRFVALNIDHDGVVAPAEMRRDFGKSIRAGGVIGTREHRVEAMFLRDVDHARRIGRDQHLLRARQPRAPSATRMTMGFTADLRERFVRQARIVARRNTAINAGATGTWAFIKLSSRQRGSKGRRACLPRSGVLRRAA